MPENLKPCPFCGGIPRRKFCPDVGAWIACDQCDTLQSWNQGRKSEQKAAAAWNTRAACPECDEWRERYNAAAVDAKVLREAINERYRIHAELETALGVAHLDSDAQMAAALERVKALEAVLDAALSEWDAYASNDCTAGKVNIAMRNLHGALYRAAPKHFDEEPLRVTPECPECLRLRADNAKLRAVADAARRLRRNEADRADAMDAGDETLYLRLLGEDSDNGVSLDAALAALDAPHGDGGAK